MRNSLPSIRPSAMACCIVIGCLGTTLPSRLLIADSNLQAQTSKSKWYKAEVYTRRTGYGGTDGDVYMGFVGKRGSTAFLFLDSPGDSHEKRNWDLYYFRADLGKVTGVDTTVHTKEATDDWTYSVFLYELSDDKTWKLIFERRGQNMKGSEDVVLEPGTPSASAHIWLDKHGEWKHKSSGKGPRGINLADRTTLE